MLLYLFKVIYDCLGCYEVNYSFQFNFLFYLVKECNDVVMSDFVCKYVNMQDFGELLVIFYDVYKVVIGVFVKKVVDVICSGEIMLFVDVEVQIVIIYVQGEYINVV